jgi:hypothetical protein
MLLNDYQSKVEFKRRILKTKVLLISLNIFFLILMCEEHTVEIDIYCNFNTE